jgi:nucleotide-binding universal stress UspA family protein
VAKAIVAGGGVQDEAVVLAIPTGGTELATLERLAPPLGIETRPGRPVEALVEAAATADLLVMGARGLSGLRALGSVSERVAHRAESSVLIVRPS